MTEIAELLQLSRQRADQLSRTKGFPDPEVELSGGRIWKREDVERWLRDTMKEGRRAMTRWRKLQEPCPQCGAALEVQEQALDVEEESGPIGWSELSRRCSRGCALTVSDFRRS